MELLPFGAIQAALLQLVKDPKVFLICIGVLWVMVWLYRDIKTGALDQRDRFVSRLDKSLETYGTLEVHMLLHLRIQSPETEKALFELIGKSYSNVSGLLFDEMSLYLRYRSLLQLRRCLGIVQDEVPKLRERYANKLPNVHDSFENSLFYVYVVLKAFVPAVVTVISMIIISFCYAMIYTGTIFSEAMLSGWLQVFALMIIAATGYLYCVNKEYRAVTKFLGLLLPLALIPVLFLTYWVYKLTLLTVVIWGCLYLMRRRNRKRRVLYSGNYI